MRDPYSTLGVGRGASTAEIKQAYRKLAKQYHPDRNPGRSDIEQRFKEISGAYAILSDPAKRGRFDRGEIDANGSERPRYSYRGGFARSSARRDNPFASTGFSPEDLFADLFGSQAGRRGGAAGSAGARTGTGPGAGTRPRAGAAGAASAAAGPARGGDISYSVTVSFLEAARGTKRRISLSTGKSIDVAIPAGTEDQQKLRLRGQGQAGTGGGETGDAIVEVHVEPHPHFTRSDTDIHIDVPVTLPEAVLGGVIRVPTLDGTVSVKVPRGANTGTTLRLRGKGIDDGKRGAAGDQYVKLKVVLPDPPDPELTEFVEQWAADRSYDVRRKLGFE